MNRKNEKTLSVSEQYNVAKAKKIAIILILLALVFLFFVVSVFVGSGTLSFKEVFLAIFNKGSETARLIVRRIRFPRVIAALIAGGGLAVSGLVMQTVLKNPLASPTTLGVSNAAVFGGELCNHRRRGGRVPLYARLVAFDKQSLSRFDFLVFIGDYRRRLDSSSCAA